MKRDIERGQFDGFIFNNVIYLIAMFIASLFPFLARTVLSVFLNTPNIAALKADGSYLFDVIYPVVGIFTFAAFIFGGWYCSYFTASKVAYKTCKPVDGLKMKLQLIIPSILIFVWNVYMGFADKFTGLMGIQFWYPAAVTSSVFGVFDKTDLLGSLSNTDLVTNNFILDGLSTMFPWLTLMYAVIYSACFSVACYYGRKKGMTAGIKKKSAYLSSIRNESGRR